MSDLKYYNYEGFGQFARDHLGFSQAVRVGDRIEISGQGGWDPKAAPPTFAGTLDAQIDQAFHNIDLAMRAAGGKGITQVFSIKSYHPQIKTTPEVMDIMAKNLEKWFPSYRPIWTAVGVESLALPEMKIEIEAVAYDPQNA